MLMINVLYDAKRLGFSSMQAFIQPSEEDKVPSVDWTYTQIYVLGAS